MVESWQEQHAIDEAGWYLAAQRYCSPNFDARPQPDITMIVIHNISLPPKQFGGAGVMQLFTNTLNPAEHPYYAEIAHLRVSAHFFIRRDGAVMQFVACLDRAWHAGVSQWRGQERCNDFSVGIELEGADDVAFEPIQYQALLALIQALKSKYSIRDIVGHSDIAPGRKTDPGPCFDWAQLGLAAPNANPDAKD